MEPVYAYLDFANNKQLIEIQNKIREVLGDVKGIEWQPAPTLHCTLFFAGNASEPSIDIAAGSISVPRRLEVIGVEMGVFENGDERALHLKLDLDDRLQGLQADLYNNMSALEVDEISEYSRPENYKPHITLCYLPPGVDAPTEIDVAFEDVVDTVVFSRHNYAPYVIVRAEQLEFKAIDGRRLMLIITSNAYIDREEEIVSQKALETYVEQSWDGDTFIASQPLLVWHGGDPIGDLIFADTHGPWLVEVAKEREPSQQINLALPHEDPITTTVGAVWDAIENSKEAWGASHGFGYRSEDRADGIYEEIYKVETSTLPAWAAANRYTLSRINKEKSVKRFAFIEQLLGSDASKEVVDDLDKAQESLDSFGVERKSLATVLKMDDEGEEEKVDDEETAEDDMPEEGDEVVVEVETEDDDEDEEKALIKALGSFIAEQVTSQAEIAEHQIAMQKEFSAALKERDAVIKAQGAKIAKLEAALGARPVRASQSEATAMGDDHPFAQQVKTAKEREQYGAMFPDLFSEQ